MGEVGEAAAYGLAIGGSLLVGGLAAAAYRLPERLAALLTAFGGGILLVAVALELVPEADREAGAWLTAAGLLAGALVYVAADRRLSREEPMEDMRRMGHAAAAGMPMEKENGDPRAQVSRGELIAVGIFVDGVPESLALGLTVAQGEIGLALLVGVLVGNLVEAYGAAQPIVAGGRSKAFAVGLLGAIGLALALATLLGGTVLADASPELIGTAQAVAAGAVLAVVCIAVIPYAFDEVSSLVAVAAVLGFTCGYLLS